MQLMFMIHIMESTSCDRNLDWIKFAIFHFLLVLIMTVKSKLLVKIYSFLRRLTIEIV